jgi:YfiH family protein
MSRAEGTAPPAGGAAWFAPEWPAPPRVRALITTRLGGVSRAPFDSFNLGAFCGDDPDAVRQNRTRLRSVLPGEPRWLRQVHGTDLVDAAEVDPHAADGLPAADGSYTRVPGVVCAVLAADCLPVLLSSPDGSMVAAVHAGWRGLSAGVIEAAVGRFSGPAPIACLGPAISAGAYEVGEEVRAAFAAVWPADEAAFTPRGGGKYACDLYRLARARLTRAGVAAIAGDDLCVHADARRFYSHRRDGRTGRCAALIWIQPDS